MNSSSSYPVISACPFCNQPFKSTGALSNHLEKKHPKLEHHRSIWKRVNSPTAGDNNDKLDATVSLTDVRSHLSIDDALRQLFSEFSDFTLQDEIDKLQEWQEEIPYSRDILEPESTPSDITEPIGDITSFPVKREAGKVISAHPFVKERQPMYNFFRPFQNAMDFKLARFFYSAHVPKARVDEFFHDGFLEQETDTPG